MEADFLYGTVRPLFILGMNRTSKDGVKKEHVRDFVFLELYGTLCLKRVEASSAA
jgi:hypothetical protein